MSTEYPGTMPSVYLLRDEQGQVLLLWSRGSSTDREIVRGTPIFGPRVADLYKTCRALTAVTGLRIEGPFYL
jgi:hypothetical protein